MPNDFVNVQLSSVGLSCSFEGFIGEFSLETGQINGACYGGKIKFASHEDGWWTLDNNVIGNQHFVSIQIATAPHTIFSPSGPSFQWEC